MQTNEIERLRSIRSFPSLVKYLRDELDWPIESEDFDELTFDYEPKELGLDSKIAVKIEEIKQLRPLTSRQPWGIFFIKFAPKRLPVVALRRALQSLVTKRRESANKADLKTWCKSDLLFISSYGEDGERAITFAHFAENKETGGSPILRVLGWDKLDAPLHIADAHDQLEEKLHWPDDEENLEAWRKTWASAFILRHREVVDTSKKLATRLADLASTIRGRVNQVLTVEDPETGPLSQLYKAFQEILIHDLSEDDFADTYAQTITYGLLAAAIEQHEPGKKTVLIVENIADMIPATNPFLKELLGKFITISGRKERIDFDELGINEVVDLLNNANLTAVLHDFGRLAQRDDPVFYFYEDFIHEYDAKKRKKRGIYFTPPHVVSFIVRSVDEILRKDFGLEDGLADTTTWGGMAKRNKDIRVPNGVSESEPFIQILDPGTGTGTFLVEVIDLIHKTMKNKWEGGGHIPLELNKLWNDYVPKHLLPRLYGFEIMMAPYTIAHMKIGLKLKETGYKFRAEERLRVYLTNTLEEAKDISGYFQQVAPALAHEAQAANKVKTNVPTTVIIGNPPYAGLSANMNPWINGLLKGQIPDGPKVRSYYEIDGKPLGERKVWLQDDYVKFIRYAQWRIENIQCGILGYISNNAYLDNPTFRGMRQQLMATFPNISALDLHGSSKKKERSPDGSSDKNVFDIQQGVGIGLFRNVPGQVESSVCHAELWGNRENKYSKLLQNTVHTIDFGPLSPNSPYYFFVPQDETNRNEYETGCKINDAVPQNNVGVVTARDKLTIAFTPNEIWNRVRDFAKIDPEVARIKYDLRKDVRDWKVSLAQADVNSSPIDRNKIVRILYRPFDIRYTYYTGKIRGFIGQPAKAIMHHMLVGDNLALLTKRQGKRTPYSYFFITDQMPESCVFESAYANNSLMPLYLYSESDTFHKNKCRHANLKIDFIEAVTGNLKLEWLGDGRGDLKKTIGPENVIHYIYAEFHSQEYRDRYAEFLKTDFPRVFLTKNIVLFRSLCQFGNDLISLHLMESDKLNKRITTFPVSGDNAVTKVGEKGKTLAGLEDGKGKLYINRTQYFDGLPEKVWNFQIGGYQVCHKWLAERKKAGRKLSVEDIEHYHKIVVAINETIKIMKQIDETIDTHGGWPIK